MRKVITLLELAIGGVFAIAVAAYVAHGYTLMVGLVA